MSDINVAWSKSLFSHASLHVFRTMMVAAAQIWPDVAPPNCVVRLWIIIIQSKNHWIKKLYSKFQIFAYKLLLPFTFQVHNSVYQIHCTVYWMANIKSFLASKLFQCIISPSNIYMHIKCKVALCTASSSECCPCKKHLIVPLHTVTQWCINFGCSTIKLWILLKILSWSKKS